MAPAAIKVDLENFEPDDARFYVKPELRFVLQETPTGYTGSANVTSANASSAATYDERGAAMYIVAVILVYGLSIVLLIGTLVKQNMRRSGANFHEDSQVSKYLQDVPNLKERSQRDQYRELKGHMKRIVESSEYRHFSHDKQQQELEQRAHIVVKPVHERRESKVPAAGARQSLGGVDIPARSLLANCNDILLASVLPQSVVVATPEGSTPPIANSSTGEREPFLRVSSKSAWGRTSIYSKRGSAPNLQVRSTAEREHHSQQRQAKTTRPPSKMIV